MHSRTDAPANADLDLGARGISAWHLRVCTCLGLCAALVSRADAQSTLATRLAIIEAAERGATSARDLLIVKSGMSSSDVQTVRMALAALGRTERPSLIPEILPALRHSLPEVRVEAANAAAQAAQGFRTIKKPLPTLTLTSVQNALIARLNVEADAGVRAALCEALARLPYTVAADVERVETTIVNLASSGPASTVDRVGVVKGLETLLRMNRSIRPAGAPAVALLQSIVRQAAARSASELLRDARVRRLALEGLTSANALDDEMVRVGAADPDAQVRRLAMRGAAISGAGMPKVLDGLLDPVALVRLEALRALRSRGDVNACDASLKATVDADMAVALVAIDQLDACAHVPAAVAALERAVTDRAELQATRGWHRNAHALLALAIAAPDRAAGALEPYVASPTWQLRAYAARAASSLKDHAALQRLAQDPDERVRQIAQTGLGVAVRPAPRQDVTITPPTVADLRRLSSPRAVIKIRDVGRFELALLTTEAPAAVLRFVQLAESGYYDGLTFDRIAPNAIVQGGQRLDQEARFPHSEAGTWPHVRGVAGLAMPDTNDAQFFVNLVDNPRFDHQYTVFAQVLNGMDVVDQILEGDVIESISILP
jgi:cyclophilin family peptidyl-prolyl cis-trans isomerase/HEAT repeat protein